MTVTKDLDGNITFDPSASPGRLTYASQLPRSILKGIWKQLVQTLRATASVATLGLYEFRWREWNNKSLLSKPFICFIHILRPQVEVDSVSNPSEKFRCDIQNVIEDKLNEGQTYRARGYALAGLVGSIVVHALEALVACLTAPTAILTGGYFPRLNTRAATSLETFPGLVCDILLFAQQFFNPHEILLMPQSRKERQVLVQSNQE